MRVEAVDGATAEQHLVHAIDRLVDDGSAVNAECASFALVAAHVMIGGASHRGTGEDRGPRRHAAVYRDRLQRLLGNLGLLPDVDDVDDRRGAGDGNRLLDRAHREIRIDCRGEFRLQLNSVAAQRLESGERERH